MVHVSPAQLSGDCFSATEPYLSDTFDVNRKIIPSREYFKGNPYKQSQILYSCLLFVAPGTAGSALPEADAGMNRKLLDKQGVCRARHLPAINRWKGDKDVLVWRSPRVSQHTWMTVKKKERMLGK
jgi:hypothetical protein